MKSYYSDAVRAEAKRLLNDKRAVGNHGFRGAQLVAWRKQRRLIREQLRKIACGERAKMRDLRAAWSAECPCMVPPGSKGTRGGHRWIFASVFGLLGGICYGWRR